MLWEQPDLWVLILRKKGKGYVKDDKAKKGDRAAG